MIYSTVEILEYSGANAAERRLGKAYVTDITGSLRTIVTNTRLRAVGLNGEYYCIRDMTGTGEAKKERIVNVVAEDDQEAPFAYSVRLAD